MSEANKVPFDSLAKKELVIICQGMLAQIKGGDFPTIKNTIEHLAERLVESETKYQALKHQHQVVRDSKKRKHNEMELFKQENMDLREILEKHNIVYSPTSTVKP